MKKNRIFWGICFLLAAAAMIANQFGALGGIKLADILFGILFVSLLCKSLFYRSIGGVTFSLAFLVIFFDEYFQVHVSTWTILFAAACLTIGFNLIFHPKHRYLNFKSSKKLMNFDMFDIDTQEYYRITFSDGTKYIERDPFESAQLSCSFGSMKIFMDHSHIINEANLYIDGSFCSIHLYVPKHWRIENKVVSSYGELEEEGQSLIDDASPKLIISGNLSFGGLKVTYI